jgi:hypothetical protein
VYKNYHMSLVAYFLNALIFSELVFVTNEDATAAFTNLGRFARDAGAK